MRQPNYRALNALAEIRDYLREIDPKGAKALMQNFNQVAKSLGGEDNWMIEKLGQ